MPWLSHAPDAEDTHRMWADPGSMHEKALRASGWWHEVPAPGSEPPANEDPPAEVPAVQVPVVEQPAPDQIKPRGQRRAAVDRES